MKLTDLNTANAKTKVEEMFPAIAITLYGIAFILLIVLYNW